MESSRGTTGKSTADPEGYDGAWDRLLSADDLLLLPPPHHHHLSVGEML